MSQGCFRFLNVNNTFTPNSQIQYLQFLFSSLHGLKYISEDGRHWTERVLWLILCLMGFVLNVYFIVPIWIKWNNQPTLTTLDSTNHPVWEIDFPAITICSPNKVVERKLESLANTSP